MTRYLAFTVLWLACSASDFYEETNYSTVTGIAAYRSALTLDWLADEDSRQREYAHAFENDAPVLQQQLENSECMEYPRPAAGKVAKLMLELLKNLEGDDDLIQDLGNTLIRTQLLVRTSQLEAEPDLSSLVRTPQVMQGEPHATLPRVLAVAWVLASDRQTTKEVGWCPIEKMTEFLNFTPPVEIAGRMRLVDPILARARYIVEDFIQSVTPLNGGWQLHPVKLKSKFKKPKAPRRSTIKPTHSTHVLRWEETPTRTEPIRTLAFFTPETTPDTTTEIIPETTIETTPEIIPETIPETTPETLPETTPDTTDVDEIIPFTASFRTSNGVGAVMYSSYLYTLVFVCCLS